MVYRAEAFSREIILVSNGERTRPVGSVPMRKAKSPPLFWRKGPVQRKAGLAEGKWTPPCCPPAFQLAESFDEQVVTDAVSFKQLEEALTLIFDAREFFINGRLDGAGRHNLCCQALIFFPK